jgi:cobalt-precorrin 5A hydrolase
MAHDQAVSVGSVAIGIGCRAGTPASDIAALLQRMLRDARLNSGEARLFSIEGKEQEAGLIEAARLLAMPLAFLSRDLLAARAADAVTRSSRVEALYDLPSIAETAALAGAGVGSRLVVPRVIAGSVTCAIATNAF